MFLSVVKKIHSEDKAMIQKFGRLQILKLLFENEFEINTIVLGSNS